MLTVGPPVSSICSPAASMSQQVLADAKDWRRLYPFAPHFAGLPDGRMHYLDEGPRAANDIAAPTLLLVHGNPTWSFHWRRLITALRPNQRCIAPDHLGCGLSDKPPRLLSLDEHIENLCALVHRLELEQVTLVAKIGAAPLVPGPCSACRNVWQ